MNTLHRKIESYLKKFYLREWIKGLVLFLFFSGVFLLFLIFLEWILWIPSSYKIFLVYFYVVLLFIFFIYFIFLPTLQYFGYFRQINEMDVARQLAEKIPELQDRLINYLELEKLSGYPLSLLEAELKRREKLLSRFDFKTYISFKDYFPYLYLLLLPLFILNFLKVSGQKKELENSYRRILAYNREFKKPAPFKIYILNDLAVKPDTSLTLQVVVSGEKIPEKIYFKTKGSENEMLRKNDTSFVWLLERISEDMTFYLQAGKYLFGPYRIQTLDYPLVEDFSFHLRFPAYVKWNRDTLLKQTYLKVPYGTEIKLSLQAKNTDTLLANYSGYEKILKQNNRFDLSFHSLHPFEELILLKNQNENLHQTFSYRVEVIPDEKPFIQVQTKTDTGFFKTKNIHMLLAEDDYGLTSLFLYYKKSNDSVYQSLKIASLKSVPAFQNTYIFPFDFNLPDTVSYRYFYRMYDNNAVSGYQYTDSKLFSFSPKDEQKHNQKIHEQSIELLSESYKNSSQTEKELNKTLEKLKTSKQLNWEEIQRIKSLLEQEKNKKENLNNLIREMEQMSKRFMEQAHDKEKAEQIKKRLEELKELQKNNKLEQEIEKYLEQMRQDKMLEKLEQLKNENAFKNQTLERTLELLKQFYIEEQLKSLSYHLKKLADKQNRLAESNLPDEEKQQKEINKQTDSLAKHFQKLDSTNKTLKNPVSTPEMKPHFKAAQMFQKQAAQSLKNHSQKANTQQKRSANKLSEMSQMLQSSMMAGQQQQEKEDIEQVKSLINTLLKVSFTEESLLNKNLSNQHQYIEVILQQNNLNNVLQKVSDTLQSIGSRHPQIGQVIFEALFQAQTAGKTSLDHLQEREFALTRMYQHKMFEQINKLIYYLNLFLDTKQKTGMAMGKGKGNQESQSPMQDQIKKRSDQIKEGMEKLMRRQGKQQGEGNPQSIYQLYKEQQQLKDLLNQFNQKYPSEEIRKLNEELDRLSDKLLRKGLNPDIYNDFLRLQYELLKLLQATYKQNQDKKRQSRNPQEQFHIPDSVRLQLIKKYFPQVEQLQYFNIPLKHPYNNTYKRYKRQLQ